MKSFFLDVEQFDGRSQLECTRPTEAESDAADDSATKADGAPKATGVAYDQHDQVAAFSGESTTTAAATDREATKYEFAWLTNILTN